MPWEGRQDRNNSGLVEQEEELPGEVIFQGCSGEWGEMFMPLFRGIKKACFMYQWLEMRLYVKLCHQR